MIWKKSINIWLGYVPVIAAVQLDFAKRKDVYSLTIRKKATAVFIIM